jgi:adenylate kinase
MRLILMGAPGAGKGTQAALLAEHFAIPAVSTGDIFRANVSHRTALGVEAKRYMDAGEYVPDAVTTRMVRSRLEEADAALGFLLDGYPRTLAQVEALDEMLKVTGLSIDAVICLTVDTDEIVQRLALRAQAESRTDDTAEVIRRRLELYREQTDPVLAVYRDRGVLTSVDGMGDVREVTARVLRAFAPA